MSSTVSAAASSHVTKNLIDGPVVAMACNEQTRTKVVSLAKESTDEDESCDSDMESTNDGDESCDSDYDAEAESMKILLEMEIISRQVQESEFYSKLYNQIKSEEFQSQLSRVRSSHSHDVLLPMVIYALGSLESSNSSKHQLAVALLLQQDFSNWISNKIEVFDPVLSPADVIALQQLGCTVLSVDEDCRRQVERPTLFFMPYASTYHTGNLLEANWLPSNINHVILLTNKMSENLGNYQDVLENGQSYGNWGVSFMDQMEYLEAIHKCIQRIKIHGIFADIYLDDVKDVTDNILLHMQLFDLPFMEKLQYLEAIQKYTQEMGIQSLGKPSDNLLYNFAFHFFNMAPEIDMKTLIQGEDGIRLKFERQFEKLWKIEQDLIAAIIESFIIEASNAHMPETEN